MDVISHFAARYERTREEELSLEDYLAECKRNPLAYATAAERMLRAIGEPATVPTAAAIGNAVANAIGVRVGSLPITPAKVLAALGKVPPVAKS